MLKMDRLRAAWTLLVSPTEVERAHHLQVVVTERCNFACAGCVKSDPLHRPSNRDMPLERFERILAGLRPRLVTLIGEGDPLLHAQLADFVRAVSVRNAKPMLSTNLSVGDEALFAELVEAGLGGVKVTLSHSNRRRYREIKGRDLFDEVLQRVALLKSIASTRRDSFILLEFWIDSESLHEVFEHLELVHAQGLSSAQFLLQRPDEQRGPLALDGRQAQLLRSAAQLARQKGIRTNFEQLARRISPGTNGRADCALPWLRAYVGVDGRMGPCVDLVSRGRTDPEIELGDALEGETPFAGEVFRGLRESFRRGVAPHAPCVGCGKGRVSDLLCALRSRTRR